MAPPKPSDTDRSSGGDPARTVALLWRHHLHGDAPARGPRRGLDVDTVVRTATALADAEGLEALTMRRLATALEVGPMTLYTYVPGKAELLDLLLDDAQAALARADTTGEPWRDRVRTLAVEELALFRAHPWAAAVSTLRPVLGPGSTAAYEHQLAAFDDTGVDDVTRDASLRHVLSFVRGCALDAENARRAAAASGVDDAQWWRQAGPVLAQVLDQERYPRATRVGAAAGAAHGSAHDPDAAFAFGLERVLDGLAALIDPAAVGTGATPSHRRL